MTGPGCYPTSHVTAAMRVARVGDSDTAQVGEQVLVVGAP
jgi:hypothetical protein